MAKISIIIPVYNSALFLEDCLSSLLQQKFGDFEIWLIDDGSTDNSGAICDRFVNDDNRIHVIHTANYGAAHARQVGIEQASGEFLCFVDSDDSMPSDGLQRMYEATVDKEGIDIVVGFCRGCHKWGKNLLQPSEYRKLLIEGRHNICTLWGKLFRKTLFSKGIPTLSPSLIMGEDMLINIYLSFMTENRVRLVRGKKVYNYIQRDTGISRRFKLTAEYETAFHSERLQMIPTTKRNEYMSVMIHRRLRMLRRLLKYAQKNHTQEELLHSAFLKELAQDIHAYHYSFWNYPRPFLWKFLRKV